MPNKMLIMSIKPEYLKKILSGSKSIELRKVKPNLSKGDLIIFYASSPQKAICGAATVSSIAEDTPSTIWNSFSDKLGIDKVKYDSYFSNSKKAYAILLDVVWEYLQPVHLNKLREAKADFRPPQSFRYLSDNDVNMLENMEKLKSLKKRVIKKRRS